METMRRLFVVLAVVLFSSWPALAAEFYGASVTDKDAPSSFMRYGIYGDLPTVGSVAPGSPAETAGFARGDVIVSINGKDLVHSKDLAEFGDKTLTIRMFDGLKWKVLTIDCNVVGKNEIRPAAGHRTEVETEASSSSADGRSASLPPLKFDDSSLSDVVVNVVADPSARLDQAQPSAPTQPLLDHPEHDLEGIEW